MAFIILFVIIDFSNPARAADSWWTTGWNWNDMSSGFMQGLNNPIGAPLKKAVGSPIGDALQWVFNQLLYGVFIFVSWLLGVAAILFGWVIKVDNVKMVLGNDAIYESWKMVRDLFNLFFILVLLFSAFCTIFQVEKYHLKKILLTLVIMALLVNFSFPVSRFIIDASNVMFYFIVNTMFSGGSGDSIFAGFADRSKIVDMLIPKGMDIGSAETTYLIAIVVFTFILMITLLVIAVMFVIRLVALGILIIFSPVGFVASIFPSTKHYADEWWGNLFKYSFFAPLMAFMMAIAFNVLSAMNRGNIEQSFTQVAQNNTIPESGIDPNLFGKMAYFAIPIVILWMGLITAQKLSIAGAGVVTGQAKKIAGWAGRQPWRGTKALVGTTGVLGGVKQAWTKRVTQPLERSRQNREAFFAGKFGDKTAAERNMKNRAAQYEKDNESLDDLKKWASGGDAAAAYTLASRGKIDQKTFGEAMDKIKDEKTKESLVSKAEDTRMDVTLDYKFKMNAKKATGDPTKKAWTNIQDAAKTEYGNLNAEAWGKQKNLTEQFKYDATHNPYAAEIQAGAKAAFVDLGKAKGGVAAIEAIKRMNGENATAIA